MDQMYLVGTDQVQMGSPGGKAYQSPTANGLWSIVDGEPSDQLCQLCADRITD
jgi:hypothetical protein